MKQSTTLFRTLLARSIACALVGGLIDSLVPKLIPGPIREAYEALDEPGLTAWDIGLIAVGLPYLVAFAYLPPLRERFAGAAGD